MKLSATGAASLALGVPVSAATARATSDIADRAGAYFGGFGHAELPPLEMITGHDFNGGLRYDDTRDETPNQSWIAIQPAARIEDIPLADQPGVLALFTIASLGIVAPEQPGTFFRRVMDFLVDREGLDAEKIVFVSTDLFRPYRDQFTEAQAGRFIERGRDEAYAAGDGSGFFIPEGHPLTPSYPSVGVYYPDPRSKAAMDDLSYPPAGYIEVAEVGISPIDQATVVSEEGGFGIERLAMAEGEDVFDFEETRLNLLRIIEDEAERTGKPLPPGYTKFASL